MDKAKLVNYFAWSLAGVVSLLAIVAWGQNFGWRFGAMSNYLLFPLCGLLAFSLMWTHYIIGAVRRLKGLPKSTIQKQLNVTGYAVLVLILLHPGLVLWQMWRDGFGLPPGSYKSYAGPANAWIIMLGSISLLVFLAYELKPWFQNRSWWPWVTTAGDIAMLVIFYHGLKLGSLTQTGWFEKVWWFYGLTLVAALSVIYYFKWKAREAKWRE